MREFENLSKREKTFLTSYIEELLEEHGYFPDAPDVPITDVFVQLREREVRSKPREVPSEALPRQQIDVESGYGRTVELQEAVEKPKFILIGEPGGGKTTTLRYIAINFAVRLAKELGLEIDWNGEKLKVFRDFNPTLSLDAAYLPVFVPLGGINEELDVERLVFDALRELVKNAREDVKALFDDRKFVRGMLENWPLMLLFDALDEAGQPVRQGLLNGFGDFAKDHPHIRMIVSMRVANFRDLSVPEEFRSTYELMPLTESKDRKTFVELWLNRLKTDHPKIQPPEPQAILDVIEHKHGALKNSLKNPLMLKMAIEMAFFGGLDALKNAGSRSNFYEFHVKRLFFRALERLGVFKIKGVRWTGERFEFVHKSDDSLLKGWSDRLFSAVMDALRALSVEMFQHGGRIARDEADKLSAVDKLNKSLSDFQKDLGNRLKVNPHAGIEFLRKDMGVVGEVGGDLYFMHKTFLEYTFSQWLFDRWRENKNAAWRYLRKCLHSPDMREPILLLAGSLKGKELEDFIKKVMHSGSEYEFLFHRDLLMAGIIAGETGYEGRLRDEIISKMPVWWWAWRWGWHPLGKLWRDAVIDMGYPQDILSNLVEALGNEDRGVLRAALYVLGLLGIRDMVMKVIERLKDKDWCVREEVVYALGSLGIKDKDVVMEIVERLEDDVWRVRAAAVEALGSLGIRDRDVVMKIFKRLEYEDSDVREVALEVLGKLGVKDKDVVMEIVERLKDRDWRVRKAAVEVLGWSSIKDSNVVKKIVERLGDESSDVREAAVWALGSLGIRDVVKKIVERLKDGDWRVRRAAVEALGSLGIRDVVKKIVERLKDRDWRVREAAVYALGSLGIKDKDVAMEIVESLKDRDWYVRRAVVETLGSLGIRDKDVAMKIVDKLEHENSGVRAAAVYALGSLGIRDREAVKKIVERLEDENSYVRAAAVYALSKLGIRDREAVKKIVERLEDEDRHVRAAAVYALSKLGIRDREAVKKIVERLEDEDRHVRAAAVRALGKLDIKDKDVVKKIVERLEDEVWGIRDAAAGVLVELSDEPEVIGKAIKKYAGPGWKQKLNYKSPHSKLGKFLRKVLRIKRLRGVIEKAIKRYTSPEWRQRLNHKLQHSKLGKSLRNVLKIKELSPDTLYPLLQRLHMLRCQQNLAWFIKVWKVNDSLASPSNVFQTILQIIGILSVLGISLGSIFYRRLIVLGLLFLLLIFIAVTCGAGSFATGSRKERLKLSWSSFWYYMNKKPSFEWIFKKLLKSPKSK